MAEGQAIAVDLVQQFVIKAHGDLEAVSELIEAHPGLVNATWDWGNGDWETGLGAASHIGRRDIALCLLDRGARLDLFAAAMLGYRDVIAAALHALPSVATAPGPHGIPLIEHARAGGSPAAEVLKLLEDQLEVASQIR